jgi:flavin-dependent dehydrogenase
MTIPPADKTVTIIGGGLSGLTAALLLNRAGFEVSLVEKKAYPFHRVCGEYISNEVLPFFKSLGIDINQFEPANITKLAVSSVSGNLFRTELDLGGFGLSRYTLDNYLYKKATDEGLKFFIGLKANDVVYADNKFIITLSDQSTLTSSFVISAHGKRSNLDKNREFFKRKSPYLGVKYHIRTDFPMDLVQLDNFEGGYCGTVKVEGDRYNLCYLSENRHLKTYGSIEEVEQQVLCKNPQLKSRFLNSDFLNERPEVINEISFAKKPLVENHILYCGDAAGMISPLCGNGMSMAIHSAKIVSDSILKHYPSREHIEQNYEKRWKNLFENRLLFGRLTQQLFGNIVLSGMAIRGLKMIPKASHYIIKSTHGKPF